MDVRPRPDARNDAELVRAATAGDRGAFAAIYDRYADRLHDFCWSVLRDRDEAADATQDAFLVAAERLGQLRDPERLRPWLYAIARSQALRRVRARSRLAPEEDMTDLPDPTTGPEQAAHQADLRELVWNAAAGLSERDRALLDLHLRHGLEGAELAEAIGVEPAHAYVLLTRLRDQVERSLGALLVARLGRADCPELSQVLSGWDGHFSPLIRKRVARHVDTCDLCGTTRRKLASPLALLAAVPPMPAPADLRVRVLDRVQLTSAGSGGEGTGGEGNGGGGSGGEETGGGGSGGEGTGGGGSGGEGTGGGGSGGEGTGGGGSAPPGSGGAAPASPVAGAPAGLPATVPPAPGTGAGQPGAAQPAVPTSGPPEGESSRRGELVGAAVHSPRAGGNDLLAGGNGQLGGGNDQLVGENDQLAEGNDEAGGGGKGRRRLAVAGLVAAMLLSVGVGVGLGWERSPAESTEASSTGGQGGPVVAGAASSTVPASSPTTTAPSSSTTSSTSGTTTSATGPALAPLLAVSPARVDLGAAGTSATFTIRNGGDEPLSWAADPSAPWLRVRPSSGSLDGGEQLRLSLTATRDALPEGDAAARVELTWSGPARSLAVALRVERGPEISGPAASPPQISVAPCPPRTTSVSATVTDESGLSSVALQWGGRSVPMTERNGRWFANLGPVANPGTVPWQVVATDTRGNTASAAGLPVRVLACR